MRNGGEFVIISSVATLAQLVEHLIRNEKVAGSIPAGGSMDSCALEEKQAGIV